MRNKPRIRFKGFTEDWEQRKVNDLFKITRGQVLATLLTTPEKTSENIYPVYSSQTKNNGLMGYYSEYLFEDAITWTTDGANAGTVNFRPGRFYSTNVNGVLINENGYACYAVSEIINKVAYKYVSKVGNPKLMNNVMAEIDIIITADIDELGRISALIEAYNQYITLHQRKLEKLKLTKKALLQKLFPKNGSQFPEIRFKGFTDAWEQRKLGEIFEYLQNNTLSRDSLNYKNPNIKNIHYGDILVKFDEILDGSNKDIPYINSELDLSKFSKSLLRDGDIIFSDTAEDDTVGKAIELQNVNAPFILSGLHTIPCRPLIPFGKGYLGNFLNSNSYRLQLRPLVQGIKVSSISKSALKDTMIEYPKNLDEQEKIGSLFYYIAKMITLHQRKLDKLQEVKKGLLQKMFI